MSTEEETKQHAMTCVTVVCVAVTVLSLLWVIAHYSANQNIAEAAASQAQFEALRAAIEAAE